MQKQIKKGKGTESTKSLSPILFEEPQIIDTSGIIIYPLILERESGGNGFASSEYRDRVTYWNLVFYNTLTNSKRLLVNNKRLVIYSFEIKESSSSSSFSSSSGSYSKTGININESNIFYNVISKDFNKTNYLDADDPTYLFVSDKTGGNFRQLSPENYHVLSWEIIPKTNKVILQAQKDDNNDKRFTEDDRVIPMIVDIKTAKQATPTFSKDFLDSLEINLNHSWKLIDGN